MRWLKMHNLIPRHQLTQKEYEECSERASQLGFPFPESTCRNSTSEPRGYNPNLGVLTNPSELERLIFSDWRKKFTLLFTPAEYVLSWIKEPPKGLIHITMSKYDKDRPYLSLEIRLLKDLDYTHGQLGTLKVGIRNKYGHRNISLWWNDVEQPKKHS